MRRLFLTILLTAVFIAGYYVGRQPGSPDIVTKLDKVWRQVYTYGQEIVAANKPATTDSYDR